MRHNIFAAVTCRRQKYCVIKATMNFNAAMEWNKEGMQ